MYNNRVVFTSFIYFLVHRKQIQDLNWQRKNDQLAGGAKLRELESKYVTWRFCTMSIFFFFFFPLCNDMCVHSQQLGIAGQQELRDRAGHRPAGEWNDSATTTAGGREQGEHPAGFLERQPEPSALATQILTVRRLWLVDWPPRILSDNTHSDQTSLLFSCKNSSGTCLSCVWTVQMFEVRRCTSLKPKENSFYKQIEFTSNETPLSELRFGTRQLQQVCLIKQVR